MNVTRMLRNSTYLTIAQFAVSLCLEPQIESELRLRPHNRYDPTTFIDCKKDGARDLIATMLFRGNLSAVKNNLGQTWHLHVDGNVPDWDAIDCAKYKPSSIVGSTDIMQMLCALDYQLILFEDKPNHETYLAKSIVMDLRIKWAEYWGWLQPYEKIEHY